MLATLAYVETAHSKVRSTVRLGLEAVSVLRAEEVASRPLHRFTDALVQRRRGNLRVGTPTGFVHWIHMGQARALRAQPIASIPESLRLWPSGAEDSPRL